MKRNHQFYLLAGAGLLAGMYLANAPTKTGIYASPFGQIFANIYVAGNNLGGGSTVSAATASSASTTAVPASAS